MKKIGIRFVVFLIILCIAIPSIYISADENGVSVSMSCTDDAKAGSEIKIRIAVGKPSQKLAGLEFTLIYDPEFVTPKITQNSENGQEMGVFVEKIPKNWEQMCSFVRSENKYYFRFAMPDKGNVYLTNESEIVLEIPFIVNTPGVAGFSIPDGEIIAVCADGSFSLLSGKGCDYSVVASGANEKFAVELGENDTAPEGGLYYLQMEATNLGDESGIIGIEFALNYDNSVFKPYITKNDNGQMDSFMVSMPQNSWEQMCTLYESENKLTLRFAALHAESIEDSEILAKSRAMKISVPFIVVGTEGDIASFTVDSVSAIGVNNKTEKIVGRGDAKNISISQRVSLVPEGMYEIRSQHLLYVAEKTSVSDFLAPLGNLYLTNKGEKVNDGFVKSGYVLTNGASMLTIVVKGDVNGNGAVDVTDYILTKRSYFGTFKPNTTQLLAMTLRGGDKPTTTDYILIKRHYFGTYNINK